MPRLRITLTRQNAIRAAIAGATLAALIFGFASGYITARVIQSRETAIYSVLAIGVLSNALMYGGAALSLSTGRRFTKTACTGGVLAVAFVIGVAALAGWRP